MNLKGRIEATKKDLQKKEFGHSGKETGVPKHFSYEEIKQIFKDVFNSDLEPIQRYRFFLKGMDRKDRFQVTRRSTTNIVMEVYGKVITFRDKNSYHALKQIPELENLFNILWETDRLRGTGRN